MLIQGHLTANEKQASTAGSGECASWQVHSKRQCSNLSDKGFPKKDSSWMV